MKKVKFQVRMIRSKIKVINNKIVKMRDKYSYTNINTIFKIKILNNPKFSFRIKIKNVRIT